MPRKVRLVAKKKASMSKRYVMVAGNPRDIDNRAYCPLHRYDKERQAQDAAAKVFGSFLDNARTYSARVFDDLTAMQATVSGLPMGWWIDKTLLEPGTFTVDLEWTKIQVKLWKE